MNWDKYRNEMDSIDFDSEFYSRTLSALGNRKKEVITVKPKKAIMIPLIIIVIAALCVTAVAVKPLLSAKDAVSVVYNIDEKMEAAFDRGEAVEINQSITSNGRVITLLATISGKDLSEFLDNPYCSSYDPDKSYTYVIYSIANADGTDYTEYMSGNEWIAHSFFVTGMEDSNETREALLHSSNGFPADGVLYEIVRCDSDLTQYKGETVYFGVNISEEPEYFPDYELSDDGQLSFPDGTDGTKAIFTLPIT